MMEQIMNYVQPELIVVAIVLYFCGMGLKQTQAIKDKYIPLILGVGGIVLCGIWVLVIHIRMNSPGGNVFQGMSIVSAILSMNTPVCVHIDGIAASMAAVVAVAADRVGMMDFANMMIHDPYFTGESG